MTDKKVPTSPEGKFGQQLRNFVEGLIRQQRFIMPVFTADPPETDPTNLWMRYDGRLRGRVWNGSGYTYYDYPMRSDITSPPAVPAYPAAPAQPSPPQTYSKTWTATWSQTYQGSTAKRTDSQGTTQALFGTQTGWGYQESLVGFDYSDIVTQLTGSTVQSISLTITPLSTYYPSGTQLSLGLHNQTAAPTTYDPASTILRYGDQEAIAAGSTITRGLPLAFAQQLRAGTAKGLVFEAPNMDGGYFGSVAGVGGGYPPPQLTIVYAK